MSKNKTPKEKPGFLCLTYGGCMKLGFVRFFHTDNTPEDEFEKYRTHYGSEVKGRYVKVVNPADVYSKLRTELTKQNVTNSYGDIYESGVSSAVKVMKDVSGVKKSHTWGMDGADDEAGPEAAEKDEPAPTTKTAKAVAGKKNAEPEEIDDNDAAAEDDGDDAEPSDVVEQAKPTKGKVTQKVVVQPTKAANKKPVKK